MYRDGETNPDESQPEQIKKPLPKITRDNVNSLLPMLREETGTEFNQIIRTFKEEQGELVQFLSMNGQVTGEKLDQVMFGAAMTYHLLKTQISKKDAPLGLDKQTEGNESENS